jgi:4-hydroxy-tetrahydrodipicolinate synthase
MTALVTPMRDGVVDEPALRALVEDQIAAGIDALVPAGTTGEGATLLPEEHARVVAVTVQAARRRVPVIAGTGSNCTREAIELARAAQQAGADGLLQVTPYYNKPTQEGLFRHFEAVARAVPLPTIVYNVPSRTSCDLLPETVARLCEIPEIVGIKEATGSVLRAEQILARTGDRMAVISGDDFTFMPLYAVGARGVISVVSNVAPRDVADLCDAAEAGRWDDARRLQYKLLPLCDALFLETNPIPVKAALALMGRIADEIRPPLLPMSAAPRDKLRAALLAYGLL